MNAPTHVWLQTRERFRPARLRALAKRFLPALLLQAGCVGLFCVIEWVGEDTAFFTRLRRLGFEWTMNQVRPSERSRPTIDGPDLPVVLVDISRMQRVNVRGEIERPYAPLADYTPRDVLDKLVNTLADMHPVAIGIDIDFSPDPTAENGTPPKDHEAFLETCYRIANLPAEGARKIPVFLGVGRTSASSLPAAWLGTDESGYREMAASILLCDREADIEPALYSLIPLSFESVDAATSPHAAAPAHAEASSAAVAAASSVSSVTRAEPNDSVAVPSQLSSMSFALAKAYDGFHGSSSPARPPRFLSWLFSETEELKLRLGREGERVVKAYYVNYAELPALRCQVIAAEELQCVSPKALALKRARIAGHVVMIGAADFGRSSDKTVMPGTRALVPGIFAHACGVLTRLQSPLRFVPGVWRNVVLGSLVTLAGILATKPLVRFGGERFTHFVEQSEVRHAVIEFGATVGVTFLLGLVLAAMWNVLWTAAIGSVAGSLFEFCLKLFIKGGAQAAIHPTAGNMSHLPVLLGLFLVAATAGRAQVPVAIVVETSASVTAQANPVDRPRPLRRGKWLWAGTVVIRPANEHLALKWTDGTITDYGTQGTGRGTGKPSADPAEADLIHITAREHDVSNVTPGELTQSYVAGLPRGDASLLYAPANGTRIALDEPMELRWIPPAGAGEVTLEVWAPTGKRPLWKSAAPAGAGRLLAPDLTARLIEAAAAGQNRFFFVCIRAGTRPTPEETSECAILPAADALVMRRELGNCGAPAGPWYHLARAAIFHRHHITHAALAEFEAALADPAHAANRQVVQQALELAKQVGQRSRAEEWSGLLAHLPADEG